MLTGSASLLMSAIILKALPGKLDIKRHSPSLLYVLVHQIWWHLICHWFSYNLPTALKLFFSIALIRRKTTSTTGVDVKHLLNVILVGK